MFFSLSFCPESTQPQIIRLDGFPTSMPNSDSHLVVEVDKIANIFITFEPILLPFISNSAAPFKFKQRRLMQPFISGSPSAIHILNHPQREMEGSEKV